MVWLNDFLCCNFITWIWVEAWYDTLRSFLFYQRRPPCFHTKYVNMLTQFIESGSRTANVHNWGPVIFPSISVFCNVVDCIYTLAFGDGFIQCAVVFSTKVFALRKKNHWIAGTWSHFRDMLTPQFSVSPRFSLRLDFILNFSFCVSYWVCFGFLQIRCGKRIFSQQSERPKISKDMALICTSVWEVCFFVKVIGVVLQETSTKRKI